MNIKIAPGWQNDRRQSSVESHVPVTFIETGGVRYCVTQSALSIRRAYLRLLLVTINFLLFALVF
jgi:hypothetical protein